MKKVMIGLFVTMFSLTIAADNTPSGYYNNAQGKVGDELKLALHEIIKDHTELSYDDVWTALMYTDEDPDNTSNVILLYSGWSYPKTNKGGGTTQWNREHTWAKSKGDFGTSRGPGTDIHHLRPTDVTVNSARGSMRFDEGGSVYTDASRYGGGSGATECYKGSDNWEPADEVKGDVARMLFYMATCYDGDGGYDNVDLVLGENQASSGTHGRLSTLLEWHVQDPVSAWEQRRNDRAYEKQGNRNPFIDHPEYVCPIWGGGDCDSIIIDPTPEDSTVVDPIEPVKGGFELTFDNDMDACTAYQLSGSTGWTQSVYKEEGYLYINTYEKGASEAWVTTPSVDLTELTNQSFSFEVSSYNADKTIIACGAGQFEVYYSNSFDGATIDKDEWTRFTEVDDVLLGDKWDFTSVNVDISDIIGDNVTFAFAHTCATDGTTWEVDNVKLQGDMPTSIGGDDAALELAIYPNPANTYFSANSSVDRVEVFTTAGVLVDVLMHVTKNETIDISSYTAGIYLVRMTKDSETAMIKLLKK